MLKLKKYYLNIHLKDGLEMKLTACLGELMHMSERRHHLTYVTHIATLWFRYVIDAKK